MKIYKISQISQAPQIGQPDPSKFQCPDIRVGDVIKVGKYKNVDASIAGFGVDENGQPTIISNEGIESKMFTFRLQKLMPGEGESY